MTEPVVVNFQVGGVAEVTRAFASISDRLEQIEKRGVSQRTRVRRAENDTQERAFAKLAREADRWKREEIRSVEKAEKDKSRSVDRAAREQIRAVESSERQKERAYAKTAREVERWEREATRTTEREAKKRASVEAAAAREKRHSFVRAIGYGVRGGISNAVRAGTGLASTALQLGGGFTIADSMDKNIKAEGAAAQVVAGTQTKKRGGYNTQDVMKRARSIAISEGIGTQDAIEGISKYKDLTGELGDAMDIAPEMAKLATATGSNLEDLMSTAGNIKVADTDNKLSKDDVMRLLKVQVSQGQTGSLEVKDMGKYGARLVAGAAMVGGDKTKAIAEVGAIAQMSKTGGATTAAEMTMAAQSFSKSMAMKADKSGKINGVQVIKDGKLTSPQRAIQELVASTNGDVGKLAHLKLGQQANKALFGAANIYNSAGGGEAGKAKLAEEFKKYTGDAAVAGEDELNAAHAQRMAATDKQIEVSMQKLHEVVGTQLVPELVKLVPELSKAIPHFARFIQGIAQLAAMFAENPIGTALAGLGAIMAATVAKEIIAAKIGDVIKGLLLGQPGGTGGIVNGVGAGGRGAGGGGGLGSALGATAATAGLAYVAKTSFDIAGSAVDGWKAGEASEDDIAANYNKTGPAGDRAREKYASAKSTMGVKGALKAMVGVQTAAGEGIVSAVTGDSSKSLENIGRFFEAGKIIDSDKIQHAVTSAITAGAIDASKQMGADPNDPKRNAPMAAGPRGGAQ